MEEIDDTDFVASEHDQLINAITKLDKTQFITEPTRNEPTNLNSEFNLIKGSRKLNLNNVVKVLEDTSHRAQISKKLKKSQDRNQVLPKPLEKPQAERIKRATGYEQTKEKLGRWDPVVARSRTVDFVSFPLKRGSNKMQPTKEFLSKLELKSPLEKELDEIDPPQVEIEEDEEEKVYPMTYEQMLDHRQSAAKLRAQQSYQAAKAKRQSKIKSKKYHRILKKERLKQQLKEFEQLRETDPEEALKKLEALEKARALERHTLRHKNTGKWAKSKLVRAKYDKETRQELAEQLAVSRGLTKKTNVNDSSDDDDDANENIPDITLSRDPMNPWMLERSDKSNVDAEFDFGYKKYVQGKLKKGDSGSESDDGDDDAVKHINEQHAGESLDMLLLKQSVNRFAQENVGSDDDSQAADPQTKADDNTPITKKESKGGASKAVKRKAEERTVEVVKCKNTKKVVATSNWIVEPVNIVFGKAKLKQDADVEQAFDAYKGTVVNKVTKKLKQLKKDIQNLENLTNASKNKSENKQEDTDSLEYLKLKKQRLRPVIDEELIETGSKRPTETNVDDKTVPLVSKTVENNDNHESININTDPNRFIVAKPKYLHSIVPEGENGQDLLDDDDEQIVPKINIEEVFEEDDVVDSFRQEKEDEINKDKPEELDHGLPGWGTWGGKGVKAPKRRKNRFITRGAPKMPRRDENKGDVIIKEFKDPKLAVHKVTNVPFPFTSVKDYEASIRAPLGSTFVTEKAHQQLIKPSVITKAGAIIEAMDEDELLVKKNRNFTNEKVLKLLGQK